MKKTLLVTLANQEYLESAKQVFSSAYNKGSWQGDFLLLADNVSENDLLWFKQKNILIKKCEDFSQKLNLTKDPKRSEKWENWMQSASKKVYLFNDYFKNWDNIVFLDSDIIVRYSLQKLALVNGFFAAEDCLNLNNQVYCENLTTQDLKNYNYLKKKYNFYSLAFNSGVMAFSTNIILQDTFENIFNLLQKYHLLAYLGDQTILNFYFYKKWKKLPLAYNGYAPFLKKFKTKTITLHAIGYVDNIWKPWEKRSPYFAEWKQNFDNAQTINFSQKPKIYLELSKSQIFFSSLLLKTKIEIDYYRRGIKIAIFYIQKYFKFFIFKIKQQEIYFSCFKNFLYNVWQFIKKIPHKAFLKIDQQIGKFGIFLKKNNPKLYYFLKKFKN